MRLIAAIDGVSSIGTASRNGTHEAGSILHYTAPEAADRLRVSEITLARWRCTKRGPLYIKSGGRVLYREADLLEYENKNARKGTRPER
ncbi:hypothetical protein B5K11_11695 [Rhizobium leguminosarum bv. trifolii]|nr:hypothetical protein B5K11_11695 [Rhizobium leguminosarum bv. trifolii]